MKVLIVDDNAVLCEMLKVCLERNHYIVDIAAAEEAGWGLADSLDYDLIILDISLPKLGGIQFCRKLRSQGKQTLVLMLTASESSADRVRALDAGADAYIVKPIGMTELEALLRALLRRRNTEFAAVLEWGQLRLNLRSCEVSYDEQPLYLTAKEYALLELLLRNPQRIFSQGAILHQIWPIEAELPDENTVREHIKRFRQRLKSVGAEDLIETMYGIGYRLNSRFCVTESPEKAETERSTVIMKEQFSTETFRQELIDQIDQLEQLLDILSKFPEQSEIRENVQYESDKLISSFRTLSLSNMIRSMRAIETLTKTAVDPLEFSAIKLNVLTLRQEIEAVELTPNQANSQANSLVLNSQPKILIVDDDRITLKLLKKTLEPWGLNVTVLDQPQQFWDYLNMSQPDLLILDVHMPEIDGIQLCEQVRSDDRWMCLPILFLTVHKDSETIQQIFGAGADDYVGKPVVAPELITRLFNRLERFRRLRQ
jgi:DNA-binding response OmpR family regulator